MNEFVVTAEQQGIRTDLFLAQASGLTRSRVAALIEQGYVQCEGKPARAKEKVRVGYRNLVIRRSAMQHPLLAEGC